MFVSLRNKKIRNFCFYLKMKNLPKLSLEIWLMILKIKRWTDRKNFLANYLRRLLKSRLKAEITPTHKFFDPNYQMSGLEIRIKPPKPFFYPNQVSGLVQRYITRKSFLHIVYTLEYRNNNDKQVIRNRITDCEVNTVLPGLLNHKKYRRYRKSFTIYFQ
jgi:hypothetical protein